MKAEKNKAFQIKCEKYAENVIGLMPEESKNKLLRAFVTSLILVRVARSDAEQKAFEGWTSEFECAHDLLAEIAGLAGLSVDYKEDGKDCLNFEFVPEDGEGGEQ